MYGARDRFRPLLRIDLCGLKQPPAFGFMLPQAKMQSLNKYLFK